jgi:hypothetical protein
MAKVACEPWLWRGSAGEGPMSGFANGTKGNEEQGKNGGSKSAMNAGHLGSASVFGKRRERPDRDLMQVLNTGSSGATQRVPRSVSPPLD